MEEAEFALFYCKNVNNECPFNYLRGFYNEKTSVLIKENLIHIIQNSGLSRQLLQFLGFVYEYEKKPEIQEIVFEKLKNIDFIRKSYWQWKKKTKKGNNLTRTIEDIKICNLVNRSECLNVMKDYYLSYYIR